MSLSGKQCLECGFHDGYHSESCSRELAAAFTEWERRYREERDRFLSESQKFAESVAKYGEACAPYFAAVMEKPPTTNPTLTCQHVNMRYAGIQDGRVFESCEDCGVVRSQAQRKDYIKWESEKQTEPEN